jgi:hypothetical protein|tara:strand:+ start:101 stop:391 length:291 start_codon:yes stop_codon:yes gene_type:complete
MKDLNQIEKRLKKSAEEELEQVVTSFARSLEFLTDKYGGGGWFDLSDEVVGHSHHSSSCMNHYRFKEALLKSLKKSYIDAMVAKKSKELIEKLELI